ncbi:MAG TPA: carbonic anhydrase [Rhizomicrobium sp.]|nr:carbonic anhydrase [Rhizomicrobium sp.]
MWGRRHRKIAVALVCADWRLHHHASQFNRQLTRALAVGGVDYIAVPGPDGLVRAERNTEWQAALGQAKLLIGAHTPVALAVVAHERCAGHPVSDDTHVGDASAMAQKLKAEAEFAGPVAAMVARYRADLKWRVEIVNRF